MLGDLPLPSATHQLTHPFYDVSEAASTTHGLAGGYLTAVSIDRKAPVIRGINRVIERTDFTLLAESGIFEAHGREDGISIIHFGELHLLRSIAGHLKRLTSGDGDRGGGDSGTLPDHIVIGDARAGAQ